ncbi:sensor histidine kinase [Hymenobacter negativus]|uniref:Histidine kinase n=1 Tax=Hymenobacter negativus TaxID=2795026 RepID=A0ABS3QDH1_9BACT|nr:histidine kinase [Hymenobacter negativus]MBO2009297.1 histidine kinase [Hymenobacter negativus]
MEIRKKIIAFFWAFLFLTVLLQLSTSEGIPFITALLYTLSVLATLWLYFHYASRPALKRFIAQRRTALRVLLLLLACTALTLALAGQGYALVKLTMPAASARVVLNDSLPSFFGLLILSGFVSCLQYLFDKYKESLRQEKQIDVLKRKALEMELNLLRNQLSPHFTFNVLNNLHFLIHKDKNEALYLLSTYSKILRYYVYESRKKAIAFSQEVAFLHEYFNLQIKQRPAELEITFDATEPDEGFCIAPFILATFVENAFKHVQPNTASEYYVRQTHSLTPHGTMTFEISNTFSEAREADEYSGVGLKHVRETLALAYPYSHQLHLQQQNGLFAVKLELTLKKC